MDTVKFFFLLFILASSRIASGQELPKRVIDYENIKEFIRQSDLVRFDLADIGIKVKGKKVVHVFDTSQSVIKGCISNNCNIDSIRITKSDHFYPQQPGKRTKRAVYIYCSIVQLVEKKFFVFISQVLRKKKGDKIMQYSNAFVMYVVNVHQKEVKVMDVRKIIAL